MAPEEKIEAMRRVRHVLKRRHLVVRRVERVTPLLARITLSGEDLQDFVSLSFDDHVKAFFPSADGGDPAARDYTAVRFNFSACELDLDFVLHGHGPAAKWAAQAQPGQALEVGGPKGSILLPEGLDWLLMAGDATALPAISRHLLHWREGCQGHITVVMPDFAERRPLDLPEGVSLQWVSSEAEAIEVLERGVPLPGRGFAWCAGEARFADSWRNVLVAQNRMDPHAIKASAYWRRG